MFNNQAQDLYSDSAALISSEFIFQKGDVQFPSCHASTIVETTDGLIAAWFGGSYERNPDVGIWLSRYIDGKWTKPGEVANGIQNKNLRYPTWNPVLFYKDQKTLLFYKAGASPSNWWGEFIFSVNNGQTWSNPIKLPDNIYGPIKNKPILLSNGELLCPSSTENDGWKVHMEFTPDMGLTWERTKALNHKDSVSAIQPTILIQSDKKLQMLCRTKSGKIYSAWSTDNGHSWTELKSTALPNPNSGIDAVTMKDGRHLLVYNHISTSKRNMLNVAVSEDGVNWEAAMLLENDNNEDNEYSYPAVIQTADGKIHITYTWKRELIKHVTLDPTKLKAKPIVNGNWPE